MGGRLAFSIAVTLSLVAAALFMESSRLSVISCSGAVCFTPGRWAGTERAVSVPLQPLTGNITRVFACGITAFVEPAVRLLFPEFCTPDRLVVVHGLVCKTDEVFDHARALNVTIGPDTLLVVRPKPNGAGFINETFPGRVLYIVTENTPYRIPPSHFGLGPYDDTSHTKRLYLASLYLNMLSDDLRPLIIGHGDAATSSSALRPKNTKEHFALFVFSNCAELRFRAVIMLSRVAPVHIGGKCARVLRRRCQNRGDCPVGWNGSLVHVNVTKRQFNRSTNDKEKLRNQSFWGLHEYYHRYRFAVVFENRKIPGYITEKIVNAFLGGSIPLYHGTEDVFKVFNRRALVYYDETNPRASIDLVKELMSNETAYDAMLDEPILANGSETIADVFSLNDAYGHGLLKRRIREMVFRS